MVRLITFSYFIYLGFTKILDSGYEEDFDLFYIAMEKLDADLSTIIKRTELGRL